jgi:hypothetical protein
MVTSCSCFARRVKSIRKNIIRQWVRYCAWGCFRHFNFPPPEAAARYRSSRMRHAAGAGSTPTVNPPMSWKKWSEREDLNLRPLVSQTSALTGLRHAPNVVPLARIAALRKARSQHFGVRAHSPGTAGKAREKRPSRPSAPDPASPGTRRGQRAPVRAAPGRWRWARQVRRECRPCGRW